jgi:hypothetical protein
MGSIVIHEKHSKIQEKEDATVHSVLKHGSIKGTLNEDQFLPNGICKKSWNDRLYSQYPFMTPKDTIVIVIPFLALLLILSGNFDSFSLMQEFIRSRVTL